MTTEKQIKYKFCLNIQCTIDDDLLIELRDCITDTVKPILSLSKQKNKIFDIEDDYFSLIKVPHDYLESIKKLFLEADFSTKYQDEIYHLKASFIQEDVNENDTSDLVFKLKLNT